MSVDPDDLDYWIMEKGKLIFINCCSHRDGLNQCRKKWTKDHQEQNWCDDHYPPNNFDIVGVEHCRYGKDNKKIMVKINVLHMLTFMRDGKEYHKQVGKTDFRKYHCLASKFDFGDK